MSNSNESAFPSVKYMGQGPVGGLTKRELLAAVCLHGILTKPIMFATSGDGTPDALRQQVAADAVKNADALLNELAKTEGDK